MSIQSPKHRSVCIAAVAAVLVAAMAAPVGATSAVDPAGEVGANDFRISEMGPNGNTGFIAVDPAVAYNPIGDLYLAVWYGSDSTAGENEIYGQLLDADGSAIGPDFRISDMGPDGNTGFNASSPAVTYNADVNQFLVVWSGDDNTAPLIDNETEIFGQLLNGSNGSQVGPNDFRISDMGPNGNTSYAAFSPAVAYNPANDRYLVVWSGDDDTAPLVDNETEIFGQLLDGPTGSLVGGNYRISDMGPDGNTSYGTGSPAIVHNAADNEFLVVWHGDDNTPPLVDNEYEIFGQRLAGVSGAPVGSNDFRISDMGPDGTANYGAFSPDVAHANPYLVVWYGDDDTAPLVDQEFEIFGQLLNGSTGSPVGPNDFRISDMGPNGNTSYYGALAAVAADPAAGEFLAVWYGHDDTPPLVTNEIEIFGQRIDAATGAAIGDNDMRLSDMGPDGATSYAAVAPDVAHANPHLVVWYGDDDTAPLVDNEYEIFGQLYEPPAGDTVGVVDVSSGVWYLRNSAGIVTTFGYGNPGDLPIAGDWDGDGDATPGLYRQSDGFFYSRNSNTTGIANAQCFAGDPADIPVVGDWDGDGDDNLGIYRPSEQRFYLYTTTCTGSPMGAAQIVMSFGNPGDKPVAGDWDGDGIDEVGLHRESTGFFYWRNTLDTGIASGQIFFGDPADRFVSGDWGILDGVDTPAVYRPSNLTFYFRHTLTQGVADSQFTWVGAGSGWLPVSGDFGLG